MEQEKYIEERMKEFAQNINEYSVGQTIIDIDGAECRITDKTANSIEVFIETKKDVKWLDKETGRYKGVDCKQWFDMRDFNKRFKSKK